MTKIDVKSGSDESAKKQEVAQDINAEAAASEEAKPQPAKVQTGGQKLGFWQKYKANKKKSIPLTILVVVLIFMLIPATRYKVLGLFISRQFSVSVVDSTTNSPISSATVSLDGKTVQTGNDGKATIKSAVGNQTLTVKKNYYQDYSQKVTVPLSDVKDAFEVKLQATGRQVPIVVTNKITKLGVENVTIKAADTEVKTDKDGKAIIVLPPDGTTVNATISAAGFNESTATIQVTDQSSDKNIFTITPAGKVYFLSKATGKINVVKSNLDGTERKTVLAGTGKEQETGTVLLASRDWKYLALLARRDSKLPKLYLINTANDKLSVMDEGDANFNLVGWHNHDFAYTVNRTNVKYWQANATSLKSYNADSDKITVLENTKSSGSSEYNAVFEEIYSTNLLGDKLIYSKNWNSYDGLLSAAGKKNVLISISPNGSNKQTVASYNATSAYFSTTSLFKPDELYITVYNQAGKDNYYELNTVGQYTKSSDTSSEDFNKSYPTYLLSPSGKQTFWGESRDGKQTLFIGDKNGDSAKKIASLSAYSVYGWYSDDYLLVSKEDSELYIMPKTGGKPVKITDYHKPDQTYYGYGGGYGGL